jgi:Tfx family DNA-binding protein
MDKREGGFLTEPQLRVLGLRLNGLTQEKIAEKLGTTRQNISLIERRARDNVEKAEQTLIAYRRLQTAAEVKLDPGTHLVDVPRMLIDAADTADIKISIDFALVYKMIRDRAGESVSGTRVTKPIVLNVLRNGEVDVDPV